MYRFETEFSDLKIELFTQTLVPSPRCKISLQSSDAVRLLYTVLH